ncbi:hypothetical protein L596_022095 [Steinernema carpocapsae]|uniref:Uncharacterized protein n=1 Tax=Steinernema carpocapsae TaxID=34508 RepID=A0A4U5ML31_STECR|nr:hypothetical protein L596_022095 [Steinernema carpocapsae]
MTRASKSAADGYFLHVERRHTPSVAVLIDHTNMLYTDSTTISGNHRIRLNCTNFLIQPKYYQNDVAQTFQNTKMRTIGFRAKA